METVFNYSSAVWVEKRFFVDFIDFVEPKEAFVVKDDMGECYAISFSSQEDLKFANLWLEELEECKEVA